jgi:PPOX class probable F420-dependent enzyme
MKLRHEHHSAVKLSGQWPSSGRRSYARYPRVDLNLNANAHGGHVVRVEGMTDIVEDAPPATKIPEYAEKYRDAIARIGFDPSDFARAYSVATRVTPTRWQVW